jgi:hypothetical protein
MSTVCRGIFELSTPRVRLAISYSFPEKREAICLGIAPKLMRILRQPVPLMPTRCYLLDALSYPATCTLAGFLLVTDGEKLLRHFVVSDAL